METHFSNRFFQGNRTSLRQAFSSNIPIVVTGHGLVQQGGDTTYPFHQDSSFWYLTGIDEPDCILVMTVEDEFLIVPRRDPIREAFDGVIDAQSLQNRSGITILLNEVDGWKRLRAILQTSQTVATLMAGPLYEKHHGMYLNPARRRLQTKLRSSVAASQIIDVRSLVSTLRCLKQPSELLALQQAIDITISTIDAVRQSDRLAQWHYEYEIEAAIGGGFRRMGATGHAFTPIVANGKKATVLHNVSNNGPVQSNAFTILDVGAEVEHYAADISRTIMSEKPTKRMLAVHQAVQRVQDYALELLRPGTLPTEYEAAVEAYMGKELKLLGLITKNDHQSIRQYFPHATSHFLGLDVHDVGDYRQPLAANMVMTCEPGIYIAEEGIGVRIEDDVLITKTGHSVLSKACSRRAY